MTWKTEITRVQALIPAAQVQADWNAVSGASVILNKPAIPTVPTYVSAFTNNVNYQTDTQVATSIAGKANTSSISAVGLSGQYADLANKPTLVALSAAAAANLAASAAVGVGTTAARADHVHQLPSFTHTGDVTGTMAAGASTVAMTLATVVTAGSYFKTTVDAKGRVTFGVATLAPSDMTSFTGLPYDQAASTYGKPTAGEVVYRFRIVRSFSLAANLTGSKCIAAVAATASSVFSIKKNGTQVATFTFAAAGTIATFSNQSIIAFSTGDLITITAPATADTTLADIDYSLLGLLG